MMTTSIEWEICEKSGSGRNKLPTVVVSYKLKEIYILYYFFYYFFKTILWVLLCEMTRPLSCTTAMCSPPCAHGGTCMRWNKCLCPPGWTGTGCHTGRHSRARARVITRGNIPTCMLLPRWLLTQGFLATGEDEVDQGWSHKNLDVVFQYTLWKKKYIVLTGKIHISANKLYLLQLECLIEFA